MKNYIFPSLDKHVTISPIHRFCKEPSSLFDSLLDNHEAQWNRKDFTVTCLGLCISSLGDICMQELIKLIKLGSPFVHWIRRGPYLFCIEGAMMYDGWLRLNRKITFALLCSLNLHHIRNLLGKHDIITFFIWVFRDKYFTLWHTAYHNPTTEACVIQKNIASKNCFHGKSFPAAYACTFYHTFHRCCNDKSPYNQKGSFRHVPCALSAQSFWDPYSGGRSTRGAGALPPQLALSTWPCTGPICFYRVRHPPHRHVTTCWGPNWPFLHISSGLSALCPNPSHPAMPTNQHQPFKEMSTFS